METRVLTADVPLLLAERLDRLAEQLERPADAIVQEALDAWIVREEERHRLTLEGLADVDAGRLIDHAAVEAWARSLGTDEPLLPPR
jgi:predicted transcriptional regulator